jgi:uncharacterized membrane protein YqjE
VTAQAPEPEVDKSLFQLSRELELLISAGLVFALLQLPDVLDAWWLRTAVHLGGSAYGTIFTLYYVAKLVAYGLIVAISGHFLLRGFWVAIMGLRTVYPDGIARERLDQGEVMRKFYANRLLPLEEIEDRVDRLAASIFAFVFLFLFLFMMLSVWALLAWIVAFITLRVTGNDRLVMPVIAGVFVLYLVPQWFVTWADRQSKKGPLSPGTEKAALRVMRGLYYTTFNFLYAPVFFTFASHSSRRRMNAILATFLYTMIAMFMFSVFTTSGILGYDSYIYYPAQSREHQLRPIHYDNLRDADAPANEPAIQSDVIDGPYLRLFVPYDAREDNDRIRAWCPEVPPLRQEGFFFSSRRRKLPEARVEQISRCLEKVYEIELDGKRIEKPGFVFYRHPAAHVAGRLAMIHVETLQPGQHLLVVRHAKLPGVKKDEDADEFFIPFWK